MGWFEWANWRCVGSMVMAVVGLSFIGCVIWPWWVKMGRLVVGGFVLWVMAVGGLRW